MSWTSLSLSIIVCSKANELTFIVNGKTCNCYFLLANGIYLEWSRFVQTIQLPQGNKRKYFAKKQEAAGRDVEHVLEVLQAWGAIVQIQTRA